jgi:hypothetical protein
MGNVPEEPVAPNCTVKMEAAKSSETYVTIYQITRHHTCASEYNELYVPP